MGVSIIAAVAQNGVIGFRGQVPWHLPEDLRHFRELTWGHPCVMGRRTWESLPAPLPGRRTLVLSRRAGYNAPGAELFASLEAALAACVGEEPFLCGGSEVYGAGLSLADRLLLTEVALSPEGDTFFPKVPPGLFVEISRRSLASDPPCAFVEYARAVAP